MDYLLNSASIYNRIPFIISSFLAFELIKLISTLLDLDSPISIRITRSIMLIFYFTFSYFAYRRRKIALWSMSILIFLSGVGNLFGAIYTLIIGSGKAEVIIAGFFFGGFFLYGGWLLFTKTKKSTKGKPENKGS